MSKHGLRISYRSSIQKYTRLIREDLLTTYSRDLHKWLIAAPIVGVVAGLVTTAIAVIILNFLWPPLLHRILRHHWAIIPILVAGFALTGIIMQLAVPDPNEHSTEEIIRSYHDYQGDVQMRPFLPKLLAAVSTVGFGGSAALEGPSIYGGGAVGSWLWTKLRRFGMEPRDRRIMLISGAAAGMGAVFRAPLTGLVFALEMPYKDDLAHEALLPSLIASVVAYATLASIMGARPLFDFGIGTTYSEKDLLWSALLGLICGLITMVFAKAFNRARAFSLRSPVPHWVKLAVGGFLTAICGLIFVSLYHGSLIPLGPNYEAVGEILSRHHGTGELVVFGVLKLAATLFSLGSGGVSAMFVPLFLTGGSFGTAFAQSIVHSTAVDLYAAVGMAAFIAGGYKTPLTAAVFVAEATGAHSYLIPALIGAAVAYAASGEASVSGAQHLHESVKVQDLSNIPVRDVMKKDVISVQDHITLRDFVDGVSTHYRHNEFPVYKDHQLVGLIPVRSLTRVHPGKWASTVIAEVMDKDVIKIDPNCNVMEALRLLMSQSRRHILFVTSSTGKVEGVLTKKDVLSALGSGAKSGCPNHPLNR